LWPLSSTTLMAFATNLRLPSRCWSSYNRRPRARPYERTSRKQTENTPLPVIPPLPRKIQVSAVLGAAITFHVIDQDADNVIVCCNGFPAECNIACTDDGRYGRGEKTAKLTVF
jgi:hypothetical protein